MRLFIAVTVDLDNDDLSIGDERSRLSWRGMDLVPQLADIIHASNLPVTWFVRADPQLHDYYGSSAYLLERYRDLWRDFSAAGNEIGWHPHILSVSDNGRYVPEREDARILEVLQDTHAQLLSLGYRFASVRMGEALGSNAIARTLARLGLRADSSAIPGRRRNDSSRVFDWSLTPNRPYRPSMADYRVPGEPALSILEVPMTVLPVQGVQEEEPLLRYANPAYRPDIFSAALERWLSSMPPAPYQLLTLILHPDEFMRRNKEHPLYAFTPAALQSNIKTLLDGASRRNIEVGGCTIAEVETIFCRKSQREQRQANQLA